MIESAECVILVGGESRRMGRDKATLSLSGITLVERVLQVVRPLFAEVYIGAHKSCLKLEALGLPVIEDSLAGRGPMVGIVSALEVSKAQWVFAVSCDLPMLEALAVEFIASYRDGADIVVPRIDGKAQTTCAFYSRRSLDTLRQSVAQGRRSIQRLLETGRSSLRVCYVDGEELVRAGADPHCLEDVDTPSDLESAREKLRSLNR